jgi:uncharacterized repeat protein (TIGR04076 family)
LLKQSKRKDYYKVLDVARDADDLRSQRWRLLYSPRRDAVPAPRTRNIDILARCVDDHSCCRARHFAQHHLTCAVLPLLAAKQRFTHTNDWMTSDAEIACPDPHCRSRLKIVRTSVRTFSHSQVTVVPVRFLSLSLRSDSH